MQQHQHQHHYHHRWQYCCAMFRSHKMLYSIFSVQMSNIPGGKWNNNNNYNHSAIQKLNVNVIIAFWHLSGCVELYVFVCSSLHHFKSFLYNFVCILDRRKSHASSQRWNLFWLKAPQCALPYLRSSKWCKVVMSFSRFHKKKGMSSCRCNIFMITQNRCVSKCVRFILA